MSQQSNMPKGIYYRSPTRIESLTKQVLKIPKVRFFSAETKKKMSLAQIGNIKAKGKPKSMGFGAQVSARLKGKQSSLKGKKLSLTTRLKMQQAQNRRVELGTHNFWKGGVNKINLKIRGSLQYRLWRESVFERDNYTCVWCGQRGGKLNADHIKPFCDYPELRFAIDNGRTLCIPCHRKTDTWGCKSK